jgi:hypothetical protein
MSYSIDEGITDAQKKIASMQAIREFDPGAYIRDQRWVSDQLKVRDCDEMEVHNGDYGPYVRYYKKFGVTRLYPGGFGNDYNLDTIFYELREKDPEKFRRLVASFRARAFKFD